jgi:hypothetical protein
MAATLNQSQKAAKMFAALEKLEGENREAGHSYAADRIRLVRLEMPDESAARLFTIISEAKG